MCGAAKIGSDAYKAQRVEKLDEIIREKGGERIGGEYVNNRSYFEVRCKNNHTWKAKYHHLMEESWCPWCSKRQVVPKQQEEELDKIIHSKDGKRLSGKYINNQSYFEVRCKNNHTWKAVYSSLVKGSWCKKCAEIYTGELNRADANDSEEKLRKYVRSKGGEILGGKYLGKDSKYEVSCSKGHIWSATFHSFICGGHWCKKCAHVHIGDKNRADAKEQEIKLQEIVNANGGEILSGTYESNLSYFEVRCKNNHTWKAVYSSLAAGYWCKKCGHIHTGKMKRGDPKKQEIKLRDFFESNGGEVLSGTYESNLSYFEVRCKNNHTRKDTFRKLMWGGGCGLCSGLVVNHEEQEIKLRKIINAKGGEILSGKYVNNQSYFEVRCKNNHTWKALYSGLVNQKRWCPICGQKTVSQDWFQAIIEKYLSTTLLKGKYFGLIRNPLTWNKLQVDLVALLPSGQKIFIEVNGIQHYKPIEIWGGTEAFNKTQGRDTWKRKVLLEQCELYKDLNYQYWEIPLVDPLNPKKNLTQNEIIEYTNKTYGTTIPLE